MVSASLLQHVPGLVGHELLDFFCGGLRDLRLRQPRVRAPELAAAACCIGDLVGMQAEAGIGGMVR